MQRYTLVPALVIGLMTTMAHADLKLGQEIDLNFFAFDGDFLWGGPHPFGGSSQYDPDGNGIFTVFVGSFEFVDPPKGKKFAAQMDIDFALPGDAGDLFIYLANTPIGVLIGPIKDPNGKNLINFVESNIGTILTDGSSISWIESFAGEVFNNPDLIITWAQIPGPGGLALLGLAGLIGCRRRRRT